MFPLEADFRVCSGGHRVNTIALPFVWVRLIPVPESATEVDAWNTPTGRLDSSDGLQHLFEMGSIPIELEGQHDVPIERMIQALADDTTENCGFDGASPQGVQLPRPHGLPPEERIALKVGFCERLVQRAFCSRPQLLGLESGDGDNATPSFPMVLHGVPQRFKREFRLAGNAMGWFLVRVPCFSHNVLFHKVRGVERVVIIEMTIEEAPAVAQPTGVLNVRAEEVVEPLASLSPQSDNIAWSEVVSRGHGDGLRHAQDLAR
jgi:hypothetical protein